MERHTTQTVSAGGVVADRIAVHGRSGRTAGHQDAAALSLGAVACHGVLGDDVVVDAADGRRQAGHRRRPGGRAEDDRLSVVAGEGVSAVEHVVKDLVALDRVERCGPQLVGYQDAARVVAHGVFEHVRVCDGHQVQSLAAVAGNHPFGRALTYRLDGTATAIVVAHGVFAGCQLP